MISAVKSYVVVAAMAGLCIVPVSAQNQSSHNSAGHTAAGSSTVAHGGTFGSSGRVSVPTVNNPATRGNGSGRNNGRSGYRGYGYGYGAPILLPYDSEYDQMPGRGTFDEGQEQQPQENTVGPTIFEHNGRVSAAMAQSRYSRAPHEQPAEEPQTQAAAGRSGQPTVLIFRDGHTEEIDNYALVGNKLIVLGEKTQKIQLGDLDLHATERANEDRGIEFKMPNQS